MSGVVAKFVFGKVLKETAANHFGRDEDPYYEVPAQNLSKVGKVMRRRKKKALPPGITEEEGLVLTKVKRRAYRLDMALGSFLGMKVGWGSVIGIIPFIGDAIDCMLALMVVKSANQLKLPMSILLHMLINVAIDFLIGLIPLVGDLIDIGYKCNTRNAILLEKHLRQKGAETLKAQGIQSWVDPSLPDDANEDAMQEDDIEAQRHQPEMTDNIRRPEAARHPSHRDDEHPPISGSSAGRTHTRSKSKGSRRDRDRRRERERDREDRRDRDSSREHRGDTERARDNRRTYH